MLHVGTTRSIPAATDDYDAARSANSSTTAVISRSARWTSASVRTIPPRLPLPCVPQLGTETSPRVRFAPAGRRGADDAVRVAFFLRKILSSQLQIASLLGTNDRWNATNPFDHRQLQCASADCRAPLARRESETESAPVTVRSARSVHTAFVPSRLAICSWLEQDLAQEECVRGRVIKRPCGQLRRIVRECDVRAELRTHGSGKPA